MARTLALYQPALVLIALGAFAKSAQFPQGIANSSGIVGKYLTDTTGTDQPGASIEVSGIIGKLDADANTARVDLTVVSAGQKVLMKAQAVVRLA